MTLRSNGGSANLAAPLAAIAAALLAAPANCELAQAAVTLPRCQEADAALVTRLDSAVNVAGEAFSFKLSETVPARGARPEIPAGTRGFGIVAFADHAHGAGQAGRLILEPRYLKLRGGAHVPALADPQLGEGIVQGQTRDVNGALAFVPVLGVAVSGYNVLHRGREVVLERGTALRIVVGDELAAGECFVLSPSEPDIR